MKLGVLAPFFRSRRADRKIVIIGPAAEERPTVGHGSGAVAPENLVDMVAAIRAAYPDTEYLVEFDEQKIRNADAVVVCVGFNIGIVLNDYRDSAKQASIASEQAEFKQTSIFHGAAN